MKYLNSTITSGRSGFSSNKFGIQFGAYATFLSFFGLAGLHKANPDFMGVPGYASSMILELFTNANLAERYPGDSDLRIRFLFHNGTASNSSTPTAYPLFGASMDTISWNEFSKGLDGFAVSSTEQWCTKCGNLTGSCAAFASGDDEKKRGYSGLPG